MNRDRVYDVAVVGAGMVGAAAAALLARAGFSVAVVEPGEMIAELNASHSYIGGGDRESPARCLWCAGLSSWVRDHAIDVGCWF